MTLAPLPADYGPWLADRFSQQAADQLLWAIIVPKFTAGRP